MTRSGAFKPQVLCQTTEGLVCMNEQGRSYVYGKKYSVAKTLMAVHQRKENYDLEENLYTEYGILLLFLPTRSQELNPVELLWNILLHRMKQVPIGYTNPKSYQNAAPLAACSSIIMENFTFDDVCKAFQMRHCVPKS